MTAAEALADVDLRVLAEEHAGEDARLPLGLDDRVADGGFPGTGFTH